MTRKRSDTNQAEIVKTAREMGAFVQDLHEVGKGCPDLLVGYRGNTELWEVKGPKEDLNDREKRWWREWEGGSPLIVRSPHDARVRLKTLDRKW